MFTTAICADPMAFAVTSAVATLAHVGTADEFNDRANWLVQVPPGVLPLTLTTATTLLPLVVASPLNSAAVMAEALPRTNPVSVLAVPVPPLATGSVPVTPVVSGSPVVLVRTPLAGVPSRGVTNVGLVAKTTLPDPVLLTMLSVTTLLELVQSLNPVAAAPGNTTL